MALCASLLEASSRGDAGQVARLLRVKSCDLNCVDENGCTALQRAAADGHVEVAGALLTAGADPNRQDSLHGNTAAHEAAWKGYSRCVALLAAARAHLQATNCAGFAPLHLACQNGHNQSCRELLLAGCHPDLQNNYGDTSLHTSARYGHAGVTRILISADCAVSEQNKNGDTALHIAAAMGRRKLTRILLEAGCDKMVRNKQDETARDIAVRKGLNEIIDILNMPAAKPKEKKGKREKNKERSVDVPDSKKKTPKEQKKKKTVTFEPAQKWSPYGCHYYPDPKSFPKPKLDSLPNEPLKKGEQYYLDLSGNIRKGPIGVGYTCYCAPFFKHMEEKMNKDKKELKQHIDRAHEKLDQKVTDLEMKTQGQISELTRCVAAERTLCRERHLHLKQWLSRGMQFRASERVKRLDYSPKGSLDVPPLKRTKSLELLDSNKEWNKINHIIRTFNENTEHYDAKDNRRKTSRSTDALDQSESCERLRHIMGYKSTDVLDCSSGQSERNSCRSQGVRCANYATNSIHNSESNAKQQNITAEIHIKSPNMSVSHSPTSGTSLRESERYNSPSRRSQTKSPQSHGYSSHKASDSECDVTMRPAQLANGSTQNNSTWKSHVLQRTIDDIRKRVKSDKDVVVHFDNDSRPNCFETISQDGYIKIPKHGVMYEQNQQFANIATQDKRKSVQEMVAIVEEQAKREPCSSPEPKPNPRTGFPVASTSAPPAEMKSLPSHKLEQPLRPAPILKDVAPKEKNKRFSFHNLIPFPTRKTFQAPKNEYDSESSDDEDDPIRATSKPGPMKDANLLKTLPLPNYENMAGPSQACNSNPHPALINPHNHNIHRTIPKDAYFHEIPNNQRINPQTFYQGENGLPNEHVISPPIIAEVVGPPLPQKPINISRNRNPLYNSTGLFDAMMQDHMVRELERVPHCYTGLDSNTEIEISNQRDFYDGSAAAGLSVYPPHGILKNHMNEHLEVRPKPQFPPDHNLLHSRLQSLAINTQLSDIQSQIDRESHNDSGYSTKVYGSSQGPSPSLSGNVDGSDGVSGHRINLSAKPPSRAVQIGASSLV